MYRQKIVALLFQLNPTNFSLVKRQLVDFVKLFEVDDLIYVKGKNTDKKNEIVSLFKPPTEDFNFLLGDAFSFLSQFDFTTDKFIYVFNDHLVLDAYSNRKFFKLCKKYECEPKIFETTGNLAENKLESFENIDLIGAYNGH